MVNVCDDSPMIAASVRKLAGSNDVVVQLCKYSYNHLFEIAGQIRDFCNNNKSSSLATNIDSYAVGDKENQVCVFLKTCTDSDINLFKKNICDSEAICFIKSDGPSQQLESLNPGQGIYFDDGDLHRASVGYRARINNVNGIITAGHFTKTAGIKVYAEFNGISKYFGVSTVSIQEGSVDAAFIKFDPGFDCTGVVGDSELYTVAMTPAVGTVVNLRSFNGHTYGPITNINKNVNYEENGVIIQAFKGLIEVNFERITIKGESGGIVYAIDSSSKKRFTVGILEGGSPVSNISNVSKAVEINKKLGAIQY